LRAALALAEARERRLSSELQHQIRNMLGIIRTIVRRTRAHAVNEQEFADHLDGRLQAIGRYHSRTTDRGVSGIDLEEMVSDELLAVLCVDSGRCTISGPQVHLTQKSAELMGLAIHELTTNSIKFGALDNSGHLVVEWSVRDCAEGRWLEFSWMETGVPLVCSAPRPYGFGRELIEEALPYQLGAITSFDLKPGGVKCSIRLPLPQSESHGPIGARRSGSPSAGEEL
jgi:two-component system, chemotaxis family, CheB/CheR fusion protein